MIFLVLKLDNKRFDVFEGNQWSSWTRLKAGKHGVYVQAGQNMPHALVKQLASLINPSQQQQEIQL